MRIPTIGLFVIASTLLGARPAAAEDGFFFRLHDARNGPFDYHRQFGEPDSSAARDSFSAGSRVGYSWNNGARIEGDLSMRRDASDRADDRALSRRFDETPSLTFFITGIFDFDGARRLQSHIGGGVQAFNTELDSALATVLAPNGSHEPYGLMFDAGLDYSVTDRTTVSLGYQYLRMSEAGVTSGTDKALDPTENEHALRFRLRVGF